MLVSIDEPVRRLQCVNIPAPLLWAMEIAVMLAMTAAAVVMQRMLTRRLQ